MAAARPAGGGGQPTKRGWHLVKFANGDAALVRWTGKKWAWGSLKHPSPSTIASWTYLGSTINDVASHSARFDNALHGLTAKQAGELMALMDIGKTGKKGQPSLVKKSGATNKGATDGGDATAINQIPSPISPNASLPSLSLGGIAVRVLEAVGAILLLVIGLRVLIGGDSPTAQIAKVARKVRR